MGLDLIASQVIGHTLRVLFSVLLVPRLEAHGENNIQGTASFYCEFQMRLGYFRVYAQTHDLMLADFLQHRTTLILLSKENQTLLDQQMQYQLHIYRNLSRF